MPDEQSRSLAEASIEEAVRLRLRADLVLRPVTPATDKRLMSRFLGLRGAKEVTLEVPRTKESRKVFIPEGWQVGLSFELADLWLQARSTVVGQCQFAAGPGRRVDALVLQRPDRLLSCDRRRSRRHKCRPDKAVAVAVWPGDQVVPRNGTDVQTGSLVDWSDRGLGIELHEPIRMQTGSRAFIRLQARNAADAAICQGSLKHCEVMEGGMWLAGFGDVTALAPGEAGNLADILAK